MVHVLDCLKEAKKRCVGCFACENACPRGAISLQQNPRGFLKCTVDAESCIDCGRCAKACPQLEYVNENTGRPDSYALVAESSVLAKSSSGGAFSLLAKWMLSSGGYVCGAVYDEDLNVVYAVSNDWETVSRMRGSKYAPSEMRHAYKEIKRHLDDGDRVLFTGLPCHVAALKKFVGPRDGLYTVDLLCAGVPSKKIYRMYIDELGSGARKVTGLSFREKNVPYGTLVVDYDDETRRVIYDDPYFKGFVSDLYKDECCANCKYAPAPRVGDLTIGDLWKCDKLLRDVDPRNGVNCILVNNDKGRELYEVLSACASYSKAVNFEFIRRFNRLNAERRTNIAMARFYYMLERGHSIEKSVKYCLEWKYDVGITGFWRVLNYGGDLTYYALYNIILDLGLEPVLIEACNPNAKPGTPPNNPARLMTKYPLYNIAPWFHDRKRQEEINHRVYTLMVGSDQVWNAGLIPDDVVFCYTLDFAAPWRNTVAYSSSFGRTTYKVDSPSKEKHVELMRRIKHVSVRESSGVDICRSLGIDAVHVLDPVMLCDMKHYEKLKSNADMSFPQKYGLCFVRHVGSHLNPLRLSKELNENFINTGGPDIDVNKNHPYPMVDVKTVENWVKAIMDCDYLLTDSFHAVAIAIVMKKQFIAVYGSMSEDTGIDRFKSLLAMFGLGDRLYSTTDEALDDGILSKEIDYDKVGARLDELRKDSMAWLKNALEIW